MASYSNSPNVSGAVANSGSGNLYTCPAGSYALLNAILTAHTFTSGLSESQLVVGGQVAASVTTNGTSGNIPTNSSNGITVPVSAGMIPKQGFYIVVGPGQTVQANGGTWAISGVQLTNGA